MGGGGVGTPWLSHAVESTGRRGSGTRSKLPSNSKSTTPLFIGELAGLHGGLLLGGGSGRPPVESISYYNVWLLQWATRGYFYRCCKISGQEYH